MQEQARHIIGGALIALPMLALIIGMMMFLHYGSNRRLANIDGEIADWLLDQEDAKAGRRPDPLRRRIKC